MTVLKKEDLKLPSWLRLYSLRVIDETLLSVELVKIDEQAPMDEWGHIHLVMAMEHKGEFQQVNGIDSATLVEFDIDQLAIKLEEV